MMLWTTSEAETQKLNFKCFQSFLKRNFRSLILNAFKSLLKLNFKYLLLMLFIISKAEFQSFNFDTWYYFWTTNYVPLWPWMLSFNRFSFFSEAEIPKLFLNIFLKLLSMPWIFLIFVELLCPWKFFHCYCLHLRACRGCAALPASFG